MADSKDAYDPRDSLSCVDAVNALFFCMGAWPKRRARVACAGANARLISGGRHPVSNATAPHVVMGEGGICERAPTFDVPIPSASLAPHPPRAGPAHQFDRYYKDGDFDSCRKRLDELTFCAKLKAAGPEQAKTMLRELLKDERTTEGVVWAPRPAPPK